MTSPLAVSPLTPWEQGVALLVLAVIGLLVFVGVGLLLDKKATRHIFHWRYRESCGRCEESRQFKREREHQDWLSKRSAAGPVSLHLEKPKGGRDV